MMTPSEQRTYERARDIWIKAAAFRRRDPLLHPTFGANVETHVTIGTHLVAWLRTVLRSLR